MDPRRVAALTRLKAEIYRRQAELLIRLAELEEEISDAMLEPDMCTTTVSQQDWPSEWVDVRNSEAEEDDRILDEKPIPLREFSELVRVKFATLKQWQCQGMPCFRGKVVPRVAVEWIRKNRKKSVAINRKYLIYFVRDLAGRIKIGITSDLPRRMVEIGRTVEGPLEILGLMSGDMRAEVALHERFAADRLEGEWFRPSEELLAAIPRKGAA